MKVPFLNLGAQHAALRGELDAAVSAVLDDTAFILGSHVEAFERAFADSVGRAYAVGCNSGTSALHLALRACEVGPGDEVLTTPHTWISTTWGISYCGATPVFADVDPDTGNLDADAADSAVSERTKAVLPVDLYGNPADLSGFERLARSHDLALIDDAAQAHGARLQGSPVGSFGDAACFSFYPGKNLGAAGEAGAVVTDDHEIAERMRRLRDHAQETRHNHTEIGFNYRMEGLQAAVLNVKLPYLEGWNSARRTAASRYETLLDEVQEVRLPESTPGAEPSHHLYPVRVTDREQVAKALRAEGVATGVHYPTPVHLQPAYRHLGYDTGDFPNAEVYAATCLSLPMFPELTAEQQQYVADNLQDALQGFAT